MAFSGMFLCLKKLDSSSILRPIKQSKPVTDGIVNLKLFNLEHNIVSIDYQFKTHIPLFKCKNVPGFASFRYLRAGYELEQYNKKNYQIANI